MNWFNEIVRLIEEKQREKQIEEYEYKRRQGLFNTHNIVIVVAFKADMLTYNRKSDAEKHHEFLTNIHKLNFSSMKKIQKKRKIEYF